MGKYVKIGEKVAEVAESAATVKKGLRAVGEAPPSAADDVAMGLGGYTEYQRTGVPSVPKAPEERVVAVDEELAAAHRAKRKQRISDAKVNASFDDQAETAEEYATRMQQFRDPRYSVEAAKQANPENMPNPDDLEITVEGRWQRWHKANEPVYRALSEDRSFQIAVQDFAGSGVYKANWIDPNAPPNTPAVFWHTDVYTDPKIGERPPIQFTENAREFGFHAGTRQASEDIKGHSSVQARHQQNMRDIEELAIRLEEQHPDGPFVDIFEDAFAEIRTNMFSGQYKGGPSWETMERVVDDYVDAIQRIADSLEGPDMFGLMAQVARAGTPDMLKSRLKQYFKGVMDYNQFPFVTNVKQGLHVKDLGHNTAGNFAKDLIGRGIFDDAELEKIYDMMDNTQQNIAFRKLLESKGYDHLIMHNGGEDFALPSIVLWKEDSIMPLWEHGQTLNYRASQKLGMKYMLSLLGGVFGVGGYGAVQQDKQGET